MSDPEAAGARRVSTGSLPASETVQSLLDDSYARFRGVHDGALSTVYPALSRADAGLFGLTIVGVDGQVLGSGDARAEFTLMSCAKPFVFALAAQHHGVDRVHELVGVNATGLAFNSIEAVERDPRGRTNPMVNAGALATTGMLTSGESGPDWARLLEGMSRFAGRPLTLDDEVYASAAGGNQRNQAI